MSVIGSREVSAGQFKPILMPKPLLVHCLKFIDPIQCGKIAILGRIWSLTTQSRLEQLSKRDRVFMLAKLDFVARTQMAYSRTALAERFLDFNFVEGRSACITLNYKDPSFQTNCLVLGNGNFTSLNGLVEFQWGLLGFQLIKTKGSGVIDSLAARNSVACIELGRVGNDAFYEKVLGRRCLLHYNISSGDCREIDVGFIFKNDQERIKTFIPFGNDQAIVHLLSSDDQDTVVVADLKNKIFKLLLSDNHYALLRVGDKVYYIGHYTKITGVITLPTCEVDNVEEEFFQSIVRNHSTSLWRQPQFLSCDDYYFKQIDSELRAYRPGSEQHVASFNLNIFGEPLDVPPCRASGVLTFSLGGKVAVWHLSTNQTYLFKTQFTDARSVEVSSDLKNLHIIRVDNSKNKYYERFEMPEVKKVARVEVRKG